MNTTHRIVMRHTVRHVVRMSAGDNQVTILKSGNPRINVVTIGVQGPVGTVAQSVLTMAEQAQAAAKQAEQLANVVQAEQQQMFSSMSLTLDHYIGALAAQE
jgi:hypothetical protein